jgi:hypothetical protein
MSSRKVFVTPRSVQKTKVQRVHVETVYPSKDCSFPILIILLRVFHFKSLAFMNAYYYNRKRSTVPQLVVRYFMVLLLGLQHNNLQINKPVLLY